MMLNIAFVGRPDVKVSGKPVNPYQVGVWTSSLCFNTTHTTNHTFVYHPYHNSSASRVTNFISLAIRQRVKKKDLCKDSQTMLFQSPTDIQCMYFIFKLPEYLSFQEKISQQLL